MSTNAPYVLEHRDGLIWCGGDPIDPEVITICDILNGLPEIQTIASCCGHGYSRFRVYFEASSVEMLLPILTVIEDMFEWFIRVEWANGGSEIYYVLDGPISGFDEANVIAGEIEKGK